MKSTNDTNHQQQPLKFIWKIIKPYKWWYALMLIAPISTAFSPLMNNYAVKLVIDFFNTNDIINYSSAIKPVMYFLISQLILEISWRISNLAEWRSQPKIRKAMLCEIYDYITWHSYSFFQNNMSGSIISKIKGICDGYYHICNAFISSITAPLCKTLFSIIFLFIINKSIFLILILFSLVYIPISISVYSKLGKMQNMIADDWHKIIGFVADKITNISTLFNFATRKRELQKLGKYYDTDNIPLQNSWYRMDFWSAVTLGLLYWFFSIGIFIYVLHLRNLKQITNGDIALIISIVYVFAENIWQLTMKLKDFIHRYADFKSSFSIMSLSQEIIDKPNAINLEVKNGDILFKKISFGYDNKNKILDSFNLHIKGGERVGIVGGSGAGKSTLISLMLKNFAVTKGDILIDEQSIYGVTSDSLRSQISFIPQDIMLFYMSIRENIAYAKEDATKEEIEEAAKVANIHEFICSLEKGYDTIVGERGIKLSGGQRQRIAIARAILKNAPILILDEATSSLDSQTEQEIQESINKLLEHNETIANKKRITVIAIAHRLSTIKNMDRIVVLEGGRVLEDGSFQKLMEKENGNFRKLWNGQVNGFMVGI